MRLALVGGAVFALCAYACAQGTKTEYDNADVVDRPDAPEPDAPAQTNAQPDAGEDSAPISDAATGDEPKPPSPDAGHCVAVGPSKTCGVSPQCGCPANMTCDLNTSADTVCVGPAGIGAAGALCVNTGSCVLGLTCLYGGTCHAFCADAGQPCGDAGNCIQLRDQTDAAVPNATVCEIKCQLQDTTSCGSGGACYPSAVTANGTDCFRAGQGALNTACMYLDDCAAGLGCVGPSPSQSHCKKWCRVGNNADCGGQTCAGFGSKLVLNGQEYGSCP
jgi:hypothetical protein